MTKAIDELLLGTEEMPLYHAVGYTWIAGLEADFHFDENTAPLIYAEIQRHGSAFAEGAVIMDFEALVDKAADILKQTPRGGPSDTQQVLNSVRHQIWNVPHLSRLVQGQADISLGLSVYGKICKKLPGSLQAERFQADIHGGWDIKMGRKDEPRSAFQRYFSSFNRADEEAKIEKIIALSDVVDATVSTVEAYAKIVAEGEMTLSEQRVENIITGLKNLAAVVDEKIISASEKQDYYDKLHQVREILQNAFSARAEKGLSVG